MKVGQIHHSQNLNIKDCQKIISELRNDMTKREEAVKLKEIELDQQLIAKIRSLGYKKEEIGKCNIRKVNLTHLS